MRSDHDPAEGMTSGSVVLEASWTGRALLEVFLLVVKRGRAINASSHAKDILEPSADCNTIGDMHQYLRVSNKP